MRAKPHRASAIFYDRLDARFQGVRNIFQCFAVAIYAAQHAAARRLLPTDPQHTSRIFIERKHVFIRQPLRANSGNFTAPIMAVQTMPRRAQPNVSTAILQHAKDPLSPQAIVRTQIGKGPEVVATETALGTHPNIALTVF